MDASVARSGSGVVCAVDLPDFDPVKSVLELWEPELWVPEMDLYVLKVSPSSSDFLLCITASSNRSGDARPEVDLRAVHRACTIGWLLNMGSSYRKGTGVAGNSDMWLVARYLDTETSGAGEQRLRHIYHAVGCNLQRSGQVRSPWNTWRLGGAMGCVHHTRWVVLTASGRRMVGSQGTQSGAPTAHCRVSSSEDWHYRRFRVQ